MKLIKTIAAVIFFVLALVALVIVSPVIYNNFLDPLARLKNSIVIGDLHSEVENRFREFLVKYPESQFSNGVTTHHIERGTINPTEHLFLYHVNVFDDIQLQVFFDNDQRVQEIAFIGD